MVEEKIDGLEREIDDLKARVAKLEADHTNCRACVEAFRIATEALKNDGELRTGGE